MPQSNEPAFERRLRAITERREQAQKKNLDEIELRARIEHLEAATVPGGSRFKMAARVRNLSGRACTAEALLQLTSSNANVLFESRRALILQGYELVSWEIAQEVPGALWGSAVDAASITVVATSSTEDPGAEARKPSPPEPRWYPRSQWRGLSFRTDRPVQARCECGKRWEIPSQAANRLAEEQGLGARLIRFGTAAERLGATFTPGATGRRVAAGNESQRNQEAYGRALLGAACPFGRDHQVELALTPVIDPFDL